MAQVAGERRRYDIEILRSVDDVRRAASEWQSFLADVCERPSFFHDPRVVELELSSTSKRREPCIVILRRDGRIQCVAPCYVQSGSFPLRLSVLRLWEFSIRYLRIFGDSIVVSASVDPAESLATALQALAEARISYDLLQLENVIVDGDTWRQAQFLSRSASGMKLEMSSRVPEKMRRLRFEGTWEEHLATLKRETRKKIRQNRRQLSAAFDGQMEMVEVNRPEEVAGFLDECQEIHQSTWKARALAEDKKNSEERLKLLEGIAKNGWFRSYLLLCASRPVAFTIGYQYEGTYYYRDMGYVQDLERRGPGSVLTYMVIEDLFGRDKQQILDFGFGENVYKRRICNEEYDAHLLYLVARNRWRWILLLQRVLRRAYDGIHRVLTKLKLDRAVRNIVKRKSAARRAAAGS